MLLEIRIRDLALLEHVELSLASGLNVVSGETGEGKSLLLLAVQLLLGARARKGLVRSGAKGASVEGRFLLDDRTRASLRERTDLVEPDATEVCLRRVVSPEGTSRAYLDGAFIPVSRLADVGSVLVDIHGQGDHLTLKQPREQAAVLDRYAGVTDAVARYGLSFRRFAAVEKELASLFEDEASVSDRRDLLAFHLNELDELAPQEGEESTLREELSILMRSTDFEAVLREVSDVLEERDGSVTEILARLARRSQNIPKSVAPDLSERLESLRVEAEDIAREAAHGADHLDGDPRRVAELSDRLDRIRNQSRRHRVSGDELHDLTERLRNELSSLPDPEERRAELESERARLLKTLAGEGAKLLEARKTAARRLEKDILESLAALRMPAATIEVVCEAESSSKGELVPTEDGPGAARFLVAANPGEPAQPLERVASGGETARILLALRGALAGHHRIPLLIFDEIDSGIGGRVGLPFGRRIAHIASHHQVLLITHLPQVAAFADLHVKVQKEVTKGRTRTLVSVLTESERQGELASMLGGDVAPAAAAAQAEALLKEARAQKVASNGGTSR